MSERTREPPVEAAPASEREHEAPAHPAPSEPEPSAPERRTFLVRAGSAAMVCGLAASYGTFGAMAVRYLYPAKPTATAWVFVADLAAFAAGSSRSFSTPAGAPVVIARQGGAGTVDDFIALSSTCPHLGCRVHWQQVEQRFFCPCHNGTFDAQGKATGGPPKEAGQSLPRYPLKVEGGLLFIEVPVEKLS